ncbi:D-Ala-D-Ala carboxypeptidase 3 (S13) domain protein [Bifidobacterium bifidum]|nr:D-Ala-D-Ala carboxypeptidase 3 (S13) domain protein [Bifidobacterium bifidum]
MLRHSDNTLAEEFGRLTALARSENNGPEGATKAVRTVLGNLKIDINGLTMADCSGLSPGSQLTVRTLAAVQQRNLTVGDGAPAAEDYRLLVWSVRRGSDTPVMMSPACFASKQVVWIRSPRWPAMCPVRMGERCLLRW